MIKLLSNKTSQSECRDKRQVDNIKTKAAQKVRKHSTLIAILECYNCYNISVLLVYTSNNNVCQLGTIKILKLKGNLLPLLILIFSIEVKGHLCSHLRNS